ncbi:putative serine/threonine protein kinase [Blattamonas nauphoetae]|uniref:Serine/threonine-protein kinase ATR n=1 Tax=Blattamonas nauphoetae TaxID=2049346 RepID=A0ABQ9YM25_9EUKA|nr:putative serine/threonine protein kinase [Blattamonas nauphoetae]
MSPFFSIQPNPSAGQEKDEATWEMDQPPFGSFSEATPELLWNLILPPLLILLQITPTPTKTLILQTLTKLITNDNTSSDAKSLSHESLLPSLTQLHSQFQNNVIPLSQIQKRSLFLTLFSLTTDSLILDPRCGLDLPLSSSTMFLDPGFSQTSFLEIQNQAPSSQPILQKSHLFPISSDTQFSSALSVLFQISFTLVMESDFHTPSHTIDTTIDLIHGILRRHEWIVGNSPSAKNMDERELSKRHQFVLQPTWMLQSDISFIKTLLNHLVRSLRSNVDISLGTTPKLVELCLKLSCYSTLRTSFHHLMTHLISLFNEGEKIDFFTHFFRESLNFLETHQTLQLTPSLTPPKKLLFSTEQSLFLSSNLSTNLSTLVVAQTLLDVLSTELPTQTLHLAVANVIKNETNATTDVFISTVSLLRTIVSLVLKWINFFGTIFTKLYKSGASTSRMISELSTCFTNWDECLILLFNCISRLQSLFPTLFLTSLGITDFSLSLSALILLFFVPPQDSRLPPSTVPFSAASAPTWFLPFIEMKALAFLSSNDLSSFTISSKTVSESLRMSCLTSLSLISPSTYQMTGMEHQTPACQSFTEGLTDFDWSSLMRLYTIPFTSVLDEHQLRSQNENSTILSRSKLILSLVFFALGDITSPLSCCHTLQLLPLFTSHFPYVDSSLIHQIIALISTFPLKILSHFSFEANTTLPVFPFSPSIIPSPSIMFPCRSRLFKQYPQFRIAFHQTLSQTVGHVFCALASFENCSSVISQTTNSPIFFQIGSPTILSSVHSRQDNENHLERNIDSRYTSQEVFLSNESGGQQVPSLRLCSTAKGSSPSSSSSSSHRNHINPEQIVNLFSRVSSKVHNTTLDTRASLSHTAELFNCSIHHDRNRHNFLDQISQTEKSSQEASTEDARSILREFNLSSIAPVVFHDTELFSCSICSKQSTSSQLPLSLETPLTHNIFSRPQSGTSIRNHSLSQVDETLVYNQLKRIHSLRHHPPSVCHKVGHCPDDCLADATSFMIHHSTSNVVSDPKDPSSLYRKIIQQTFDSNRISQSFLSLQIWQPLMTLVKPCYESTTRASFIKHSLPHFVQHAAFGDLIQNKQYFSSILFMLSDPKPVVSHAVSEIIPLYLQPRFAPLGTLSLSSPLLFDSKDPVQHLLQQKRLPYSFVPLIGSSDIYLHIPTPSTIAFPRHLLSNLTEDGSRSAILSSLTPSISSIQQESALENTLATEDSILHSFHEVSLTQDPSFSQGFGLEPISPSMTHFTSQSPPNSPHGNKVLKTQQSHLLEIASPLHRSKTLLSKFGRFRPKARETDEQDDRPALDSTDTQVPQPLKRTLTQSDSPINTELFTTHFSCHYTLSLAVFSEDYFSDDETEYIDRCLSSMVESSNSSHQSHPQSRTKDSNLYTDRCASQGLVRQLLGMHDLQKETQSDKTPEQSPISVSSPIFDALIRIGAYIGQMGTRHSLSIYLNVTEQETIPTTDLQSRTSANKIAFQTITEIFPNHIDADQEDISPTHLPTLRKHPSYVELLLRRSKQGSVHASSQPQPLRNEDKTERSTIKREEASRATDSPLLEAVPPREKNDKISSDDFPPSPDLKGVGTAKPAMKTTRTLGLLRKKASITPQKDQQRESSQNDQNIPEPEPLQRSLTIARAPSIYSKHSTSIDRNQSDCRTSSEPTYNSLLPSWMLFFHEENEKHYFQRHTDSKRFGQMNEHQLRFSYCLHHLFSVPHLLDRAPFSQHPLYGQPFSFIVFFFISSMSDQNFSQRTEAFSALHRLASLLSLRSLELLLGPVQLDVALIVVSSLITLHHNQTLTQSLQTLATCPISTNSHSNTFILQIFQELSDPMLFYVPILLCNQSPQTYVKSALHSILPLLFVDYVQTVVNSEPDFQLNSATLPPLVPSASFTALGLLLQQTSTPNTIQSSQPSLKLESPPTDLVEKTPYQNRIVDPLLTPQLPPGNFGPESQSQKQNKQAPPHLTLIVDNLQILLYSLMTTIPNATQSPLSQSVYDSVQTQSPLLPLKPASVSVSSKGMQILMRFLSFTSFSTFFPYVKSTLTEYSLIQLGLSYDSCFDPSGKPHSMYPSSTFFKTSSPLSTNTPNQMNNLDPTATQSIPIPAQQDISSFFPRLLPPPLFSLARLADINYKYLTREETHNIKQPSQHALLLSPRFGHPFSPPEGHIRPGHLDTQGLYGHGQFDSLLASSFMPTPTMSYVAITSPPDPNPTSPEQNRSGSRGLTPESSFRFTFSFSTEANEYASYATYEYKPQVPKPLKMFDLPTAFLVSHFLQSDYLHVVSFLSSILLCGVNSKRLIALKALIVIVPLLYFNDHLIQRKGSQRKELSPRPPALQPITPVLISVDQNPTPSATDMSDTQTDQLSKGGTKKKGKGKAKRTPKQQKQMIKNEQSQLQMEPDVLREPRPPLHSHEFSPPLLQIGSGNRLSVASIASLTSESPMFAPPKPVVPKYSLTGNLRRNPLPKVTSLKQPVSVDGQTLGKAGDNNDFIEQEIAISSPDVLTSPHISPLVRPPFPTFLDASLPKLLSTLRTFSQELLDEIKFQRDNILDQHDLIIALNTVYIMLVESLQHEHLVDYHEQLYVDLVICQQCVAMVSHPPFKEIVSALHVFLEQLIIIYQPILEFDSLVPSTVFTSPLLLIGAGSHNRNSRNEVNDLMFNHHVFVDYQSMLNGSHPLLLFLYFLRGVTDGSPKVRLLTLQQLTNNFLIPYSTDLIESFREDSFLNSDRISVFKPKLNFTFVAPDQNGLPVSFSKTFTVLLKPLFDLLIRLTHDNDEDVRLEAVRSIGLLGAFDSSLLNVIPTSLFTFVANCITAISPSDSHTLIGQTAQHNSVLTASSHQSLSSLSNSSGTYFSLDHTSKTLGQFIEYLVTDLSLIPQERRKKIQRLPTIPAPPALNPIRSSNRPITMTSSRGASKQSREMGKIVHFCSPSSFSQREIYHNSALAIALIEILAPEYEAATIDEDVIGIALQCLLKIRIADHTINNCPGPAPIGSTLYSPGLDESDSAVHTPRSIRSSGRGRQPKVAKPRNSGPSKSTMILENGCGIGSEGIFEYLDPQTRQVVSLLRSSHYSPTPESLQSLPSGQDLSSSFSTIDLESTGSSECRIHNHKQWFHQWSLKLCRRAQNLLYRAGVQSGPKSFFFSTSSPSLILHPIPQLLPQNFSDSQLMDSADPISKNTFDRFDDPLHTTPTPSDRSNRPNNQNFRYGEYYRIKPCKPNRTHTFDYPPIFGSILLERRILFQACEHTLEVPALSRMLLPYFIEAIIFSGNDDDIRAIVDEIRGIFSLSIQQSGQSPSLTSMAQTDVVLSCQLLFDFFDQWNEWMSRRAFLSPLFYRMEFFKKEITPLLMAQSAIACCSYPRALLYLEEYARQNDILPYTPTSQHKITPELHTYYQIIFRALDFKEELMGLVSQNPLFDSTSGDELMLNNQPEEAAKIFEQFLSQQNIQSQSSPSFRTIEGKLYQAWFDLGRYELIIYNQQRKMLPQPQIQPSQSSLSASLSTLKSIFPQISEVDDTQLNGPVLGAQWRLTRWAPLDSAIQSYDNLRDTSYSFSTYLSIIMIAIKQKDYLKAQRLLEDIRPTLLPPIAASSSEGYVRAYHGLLEMHILADVEIGLQWITTIKKWAEKRIIDGLSFRNEDENPVLSQSAYYSRVPFPSSPWIGWSERSACVDLSFKSIELLESVHLSIVEAANLEINDYHNLISIEIETLYKLSDSQADFEPTHLSVQEEATSFRDRVHRLTMANPTHALYHLQSINTELVTISYVHQSLITSSALAISRSARKAGPVGAASSHFSRLRVEHTRLSEILNVIVSRTDDGDGSSQRDVKNHYPLYSSLLSRPFLKALIASNYHPVTSAHLSTFPHVALHQVQASSPPAHSPTFALRGIDESLSHALLLEQCKLNVSEKNDDLAISRFLSYLPPLVPSAFSNSPINNLHKHSMLNAPAVIQRSQLIECLTPFISVQRAISPSYPSTPLSSEFGSDQLHPFTTSSLAYLLRSNAIPIEDRLCLYATRLFIEHKTLSSGTIDLIFKHLTKQQSHWEKSSFVAAEYYYQSWQDSRKRLMEMKGIKFISEDNPDGNVPALNQTEISSTREVRKLDGTRNKRDKDKEEIDSVEGECRKGLQDVLTALLRTLQHGKRFQHHAMSILLRLWFQHYDPTFEAILNSIPVVHYYHSLSHLVSIVRTNNPDVAKSSANVIAKVLSTYPKQAYWNAMTLFEITGGSADSSSELSSKEKYLATLEGIKNTAHLKYLQINQPRINATSVKSIPIPSTPKLPPFKKDKNGKIVESNPMKKDKNGKPTGSTANPYALGRVEHPWVAAQLTRDIITQFCVDKEYIRLDLPPKKITVFPLSFFMLPPDLSLPLVIPTIRYLNIESLPPVQPPPSQIKSDQYQTATIALTSPTKVATEKTSQVSITYPSSNQGLPSPTIDGLGGSVEFLPSMMVPRKIVLIGTDGKSYGFLVKPGDDMRKDMRLMEFNGLVNRIMQQKKIRGTKGVSIVVFSVIPTSQKSGFLEWVNGLRSLRSFTTELYPMYTPFSFSSFYDYYRKNITYKPNVPETEKALIDRITHFQTLTRMASPVLHHWIVNESRDASDWIELSQTFTRSTAIWSIVGYIIGLGDRHLDNILLLEDSARVVHVDFGILFDRGKRLPTPEIVPFRLTQNIVDCFGVNGPNGLFRSTCESILDVLRANSSCLLSVWESFFQDTVFVTPNERTTAVQVSVIMSQMKGRLLGNVSGTPQSVKGTVDWLIDESMAQEKLSRMYQGWTAWI